MIYVESESGNSFPSSGATYWIKGVYENTILDNISAVTVTQSWITVDPNWVDLYNPDKQIGYNVIVEPNDGPYRSGALILRCVDNDGAALTYYFWIYQGTGEVVARPIWMDTFYTAYYNNTFNYTIKHNDEIIYSGKSYCAPGAGGAVVQVNKIASDYLHTGLGDIRELDDDVVPEDSYGVFSLCDEFGTAYMNWEFLKDYTQGWVGQSEYNMTEPVNGHLDVRMKALFTQYNGIEPPEPIDYESMYLTIEPVEYGVIAPYNLNYGNTVFYSLNDGQWTDFDRKTISVAPGDKIRLKSNIIPHLGGIKRNGAKFIVYGNLASLYNGDDFRTQPVNIGSNIETLKSFFNGTNVVNAENLIFPSTTYPGETCAYMFQNCVYLEKAPKQIPSITAGTQSFIYMFDGCTRLTTIPSIGPSLHVTSGYPIDYAPFNHMFRGCTSLRYINATFPSAISASSPSYHPFGAMFEGCSNLENGPTLPALSFSINGIYQWMFLDSGIRIAPTLPATGLTTACYERMFEGCTRLEIPPQLPVTTLTQSCYYGMFRGCTSLKTAPELPATTLAQGCYGSMFADCTSLTTAPVLSAATLANSCYSDMFSGCTSLSRIECYAINMGAYYPTDKWTYGVSSTGTFVKVRGVEWTRGMNGIPSNWTVVEV